MPVYNALIGFAQAAHGLDSTNKRKLILFAAGVKQNAYVSLKISPENLGEKHHLERHLLDAGVLFNVSRARGYEEISTVRKNRVRWRQAGIWFGYDLFRDLSSLARFRKYVALVRRRRHSEADALGAVLYGYPACCTRQYTKEHDVEYLRAHYSYDSYYSRMHETDRKYPFVFHYPCSLQCSATARLNALYKRVLKRLARRFFNRFTDKRTYSVKVLVDSESDVQDRKGKTVWPVRESHDYALITQEPVEGHHYMISYLSRASIVRGTSLNASIRVQHDYADVQLGDVVAVLDEPVHERKFLVVNRQY